jgi:hypothetical protein
MALGPENSAVDRAVTRLWKIQRQGGAIRVETAPSRQGSGSSPVDAGHVRGRAP